MEKGQLMTELEDKLYHALSALVSCLDRDNGLGGITLPTEAALLHAKDVIQDIRQGKLL